MHLPYSRKSCAICANYEGRAVVKREMNTYMINEKVFERCVIDGLKRYAISNVCGNFDPLPGFNGRK